MMKRAASALTLGLALFVGVEGPGRCQMMDIGIPSAPQESRDFYFSIQAYFGVPEREIIAVKEKKIPDEEMAVVFLVAQRAHVPPAAVVDLRLEGRPWIDITLSFGLSPDIFYVPVRAEILAPPYGRAYGHYKKKPGKGRKKTRLADVDIINLANLKFLSEQYRYAPEEVIKMRSAGKDFMTIHDAIKERRRRGSSKHPSL